MKKAIIYGWLDFPRGSSSANYVQYLGLALKEIGYDVYILSNSTDKSASNSDEYKGLKCVYYWSGTGKVRHYIDFNFRRGKIYSDAIKKIGLGPGDLLISYCQFREEFSDQLKYAKKQGAKTIACVTEYFSRNDFTNKWKEWSYYQTLEKIIPAHDYLFPISTFIQKKYPSMRSLLLPIMADTREYALKQKEADGKYIIIYPANGLMKDALEPMLQAIVQLPKEIRNRIEFHITSASEEIVRKVVDDEMLGKTVFVHGWLEYDSLIELYQKAHFLFLARPKNQMTVANFPSKVPEAMTYGVIPIVSKVGDYTKYYLTDGVNSIIFDGCKVDNCVEAIVRAVTMSNIEIHGIGANARKTAESRFDYRVWCNKIEDFLQESIGRSEDGCLSENKNIKT